MVDINDQCFGGVAPGAGWDDGLTPSLATALQWDAAGGEVGSDPPDRNLNDIATRLAQNGSGLVETAEGLASNVDGFGARRRAPRDDFRGGRERVEAGPGAPPDDQKPLGGWALFFVILIALVVLGGAGYLAYMRIQNEARLAETNPEMYAQVRRDELLADFGEAALANA